MLTKYEFKEQIMQMFVGYQFEYDDFDISFVPLYFKMTNNIYFRINFELSNHFNVYDSTKDKIVYQSPRREYKTFDEFLDEIVIFKELLLPRYLNEKEQ
jgi:hypothetical protein